MIESAMTDVARSGPSGGRVILRVAGRPRPRTGHVAPPAPRRPSPFDIRHSTFDIRRRAGRRRPDAGFTLLELIIVVALIGIIAGIAVPNLIQRPRAAREAVLRHNLMTLRDVLDQYHGDKGHYPSSLETLVEDGYLRSVPVDPITDSSDTWVVVHEEPDPDYVPAETDLPEDGAPGIIDVHSGSEELSLDGTPYAEW